ncbi:pyridoxal-phosphate dependent enzyme [Rhizobium ruizarguesonis]|uniref:pyridoxal-phosphate dependent enzyme n=1 Tax=Rhizobium ruizarguesonis TaxID=2081791 RepID=UPI0037C6FB24
MGCPSCHALGWPSNVSPVYDAARLGTYRNLPYLNFPSLGEGNTPLIKSDHLSMALGVNLYLKLESANPTGSHKDRCSALTAARALDIGAEEIVCASNGNGGISLAAYSARAGLACAVATTTSLDSCTRSALLMLGARIIQFDRSVDRWQYLAGHLGSKTHFPATNACFPPTGSCAFGVDAYKSIAYELSDFFLDRGINYVIAPAARGDLIWGLSRGLVEIASSAGSASPPKVIAAEPYPRISVALSTNDYRQTFPGDAFATPSIASDTVTYQALCALRATAGAAVVVTPEEVMDAHRQSWRHGHIMERSSSAAVAAALKLGREGQFNSDDIVVVVVTASAWREDFRPG